MIMVVSQHRLLSVMRTIFTMLACSGSILSAPLLADDKSARISTGESSPKRILAIKANVGKDSSFDKAFAATVAAGSETQVIPIDWNTLETTPRGYEPATNFLAIANFYYAATRTPIHLSIRPVHTNLKVVPTDLINKPLNDPETIRRFELLLDWIALQIPDVELTSLVIGSEVDIYVWGNAQRWDEWIGFYASVSAHARKNFPETRISSETTFSAIGGADARRVRDLHKYSDAIGVSYYPMREALSGVKPPAVVHEDFATVAGAFPDKPIIFYQIGYPSSEKLGSSQAMQSEFIREAFSAWDDNAKSILMLNFQWLHEAPQRGLDEYVDYYGFDSEHFRAFLGSLGLKSWAGEPKLAWRKIVEEARKREFGVAEAEH